MNSEWAHNTQNLNLGREEGHEGPWLHGTILILMVEEEEEIRNYRYKISSYRNCTLR